MFVLVRERKIRRRREHANISECAQECLEVIAAQRVSLCSRCEVTLTFASVTIKVASAATMYDTERRQEGVEGVSWL